MGALAKVSGIFVVIVIIGIAWSFDFWLFDPGSTGNPQSEPQNERLDDGIIQVAIADIPSYADKEIVTNSINALDYTWTKYNPELNFEYTTDEYNELYIYWEKAPKEHIGFQKGKSIMIGLGQFDCNGKWQHYSQETITDTITHETGHWLGLLHHKDKRHLMYGDDEFVQDPFETLGYNIPPKITEYNSYVNSKEPNQKLGELAAKINTMGISLGIDKNIVAGSSHVQKLFQDYNKLVNDHNKLVNIVNCFSEPYKPTSELSSPSDCESINWDKDKLAGISSSTYKTITLEDGRKMMCMNPDWEDLCIVNYKRGCIP